ATSTTEIYTLSLHDALPIFEIGQLGAVGDEGVEQPPAEQRRVAQHPQLPLPGDHERAAPALGRPVHLPHRHEGRRPVTVPQQGRSEEHTSELQSLAYLVCRL